MLVHHSWVCCDPLASLELLPSYCTFLLRLQSAHHWLVAVAAAAVGVAPRTDAIVVVVFSLAKPIVSLVFVLPSPSWPLVFFVHVDVDVPLFERIVGLVLIDI